MSQQSQTSLIKVILITGLIAGTLDATAAIIYYQADPLKMFQHIAGGAFGKETALAGGLPMSVMGIIFHYVIAYSWTTLFFILYPKMINALSWNRFLTGLLYGFVIWIVMNLVVLPISKIPARPFNLAAAIPGALILSFAIGMPLSFSAYRYYLGNNK